MAMDQGMAEGAIGKTVLALAVAGLASGVLAGCATPPADPTARAEFEQNNDPLEPANRYFFELNRFADFLLIRPWADTYRRVVPTYGQQRVHNILSNMGQPLDFANELLQGRFPDSANTAGRFLINTTLGVGGIFDVATDFGLPNKDADFGQTLYTWGFPEGPYLVLPLLGPSNPRDAVGFGVDAYADPVGQAFSIGKLSVANYSTFGANAIDKRAEYVEPMDALEKSSIDFYAAVRSMARQHRAKDLGMSAPDTGYPTFDDVAPVPKTK